MSELHWHPFFEEWVIVAGKRQGRPNLPQTGCPFCPGSGKVPASYEAMAYPNDFPGLHMDSLAEEVPSPLYQNAPATGICEVVLYSPEHEQTFTSLRPEQVDRVIALWQNRYKELGSKKEIKYVFIFENKGREIGATIPHPHGQIYAFGFTPAKLHVDTESQKKYFEKNRRCLGCDLAAEEARGSKRKILENNSWVVSVPYYARYPFETQVIPKRHVGSLLDLTPAECKDLNAALLELTARYDGMFGFSFPYMMLQYAKPTDGLEHPYYHFRIVFLGLYRSAEKLKYIAGCESGAGAFLTDMTPETAAEQIKNAKFK